MTTEEFELKMKEIAPKIPALAQVSVEIALQELYADMSVRIFEDNLTVNGTSFGGYESEEYAALRASLGRQAGTKDLQVYGNLRRSMRTNKEKRAIVVEDSIKVKSIPSKKTGRSRSADPSIVMRGQEQQIVGVPGTGIFEASQTEVKRVVEIIGLSFNRLLKKELATV